MHPGLALKILFMILAPISLSFKMSKDPCCAFLPEMKEAWLLGPLGGRDSRLRALLGPS